MLVRQCGRPNWGEGLRQGVAIFLMKKLTFGHFSGRPYGGVLYLGVWGAGSSGPPASARAVGSMKTIPGGGRSRLEPRMPTAACQRLGRQDLPSPARVGEEPAKPPTARLETATPASTQALGGPLAIGDGAGSFVFPPSSVRQERPLASWLRLETQVGARGGNGTIKGSS